MGQDPGIDSSPAFQHVHTITGHKRAVATAKFSPSGETLATGSADANIMLWDAQDGREIRTLTGHSRGISDVAWSPNGAFLCSASDDNTLRFWDVETGTCLRTLSGHTNYVFCCNFSPHGNLLASGSFDETLRVWDVRSSTVLREVPAHSDPITAVDFSWDGTLIVSSSLDGLCRVWDTATSHCLKTLFDKDSPPVSHVRFTSNGRYLLSASLDGRIRLWDYEKGKAIKFYQSHTNKKYCMPCVLCSTEGAPVAVPSTKGTTNGSLPSASMPWVVTGSEDGNVYVYGLSSQKVLQVIGSKGETTEPSAESAHGDAVLSVEVHPHMPIIASCGHEKDATVKLWQHKPPE